MISELGDTSSLPKFVSIYLEYLQGVRPKDHPRNLREAVLLALHRFLTQPGGRAPELAKSLHALSAVVEANRNGDEQAALQVLTNEIEIEGVEADAFLVLAAVLQQQADRTQDAIRTIARAAVENQDLVPLLPLVEIFSGARWATLAGLGPSVEMVICLDLYLRATGDTRARSYKRFAVEELMKAESCNSIVDLIDKFGQSKHDHRLLDYFFDIACDLATLELLPGIGGSRRSMQLRIDMLRRLSKYSRSNVLRFLEEAKILEEGVDVSDGLELLDDSRVYVDESRVITGINRELAADFQRYLHLVRSGIGTSESFADILRSIKSPTTKIFQIPTNDADDLFGEITYRIVDRFLNDPVSGLDIHVGRRIRHGTIASHLRGPVEALGLIGQRPRAGADYAPPDAIAPFAANLDAKSKARLHAAFARFSESIDALVSLLRDEYFHVRSKNKPHGMFGVPITAVFLALARGIAQTCPTIEEYARHCIQLSWMFLAAKMASAKPPMLQETRRSINTSFEKLFHELRAIGVQEPSLQGKLQHALEDLRKRVNPLGNWMRVPKANVEGRAFSMQRVVDVAVALVRGQHPAFKPIVSSEVPDNVALDYYGFSVVSDALYIALDNVFEHSGKKTDNRVNISISFDDTASMLSFSVVSELGRNGRTPEKEARIRSIRSDIAKRTYVDRARRDRNSGLAKLAALVLQSDKTSISFDWIGHTHFSLKFDLLYLGGGLDARDATDGLIAGLEEEVQLHTQEEHEASGSAY
jgi:hypothetical protein